MAERSSQFSVSLDPGQGAAGAGDWVELLANGLTFDLVGLAPGPASPEPPRIPDSEPRFGGPDTITLRPGPHIAAGARLPPVVRSLAWLAAQLAALPGAQAIAWHPARNWCEPEPFRNSVLRWIEGGVFPGLSLAAFARMPDGGLQSHGLALFTGQELRLEPDLTEDRAAAVKVGLRLLHWLVEHGRLETAQAATDPEGRPLLLEPSANGRFVRACRG